MQPLNNYASRLGGEAHHSRILCPGPGHSKFDRSLSVTFAADGTFKVHSFAGDDWQECRDYVKFVLGLSDSAPVVVPRPEPIIPIASNDNLARAMSVWRQAVPVSGTLAEAYLASRGVSYAGDALRFHGACLMAGARYPAMIGLMTDIVTGAPTGVHRTALLPDGSGKAAPGKMMLGAAKGAVVRLSADEDVSAGLAVAEGIETALAAPFRPIWACLSAGTMASFPVLSGIEALTIYADHDSAGLDAANDCGRRWHDAGREVTRSMPTVAGTDFADLQVAA